MAESKIDYSGEVQHLRKTFRDGRTRPISYRLQQLKQFLKMMTENKALFAEALHQDLRKPSFESIMMEYTVLVSDATKFIENLPEWAAFQETDRDMLNKLNTCGIKYEPYGVALIIGAWNYPLLLALHPFIGCMAAGNCAVLKPSEMSPATATLLDNLMPRYMDQDCYKVILGAKDETTALLRERFDYIFYTGGPVVGRIIMQAAAKYLTPVTLELGGKSPCFVDSDCNFQVTARRIIWGKFVNAGQTCLAPDYILCTKETEGKLMKALGKAIDDFYGKEPKDSPDLARIVNDRHFKRLTSLLDEKKVAIGGQVDEEQKYISPTIMTGVTLDDPIMKEEIFGPILPVMNVNSPEEAVRIIADHEKPLAMYIFSNNQENIDKLLNETSSGAVCVNDSIVHAAVPSLPFGGVGQSGMGAYHGKFSFQCFSHAKACLIKKQNLEALNAIRYPPYTDRNLKTAIWFLMPSKFAKYFKYFYYFAIFGALAFLFQYCDIWSVLTKK